MNKHCQFCVILSSCLIFLTCCSKDDDQKFPVSVYVSGKTLDKKVGGFVTTYWKDDKAVYLDDVIDATSRNITSIFVDGYDFYVATTNLVDGMYYEARYWKNGTSIKLSGISENSFAYSIFADRGDVYIAGSTFTKDKIPSVSIATYWKNGIPVYLTDGSNNAEATSVYVTGNFVYVAGYEQIADQYISSATYWKNGEAIHVSEEESVVTSIFVSGNNIYLAGNILKRKDFFSVTPIATYWVNGKEIQLTDGKADSRAEAIFVDNKDVYVAGSVVGHDIPCWIATYWKNGKPVYLTDGRSNAVAKSVYVKDKDVYIAGETPTTGEWRAATYWKNGITVYLTDDEHLSTAHSIFVK